MKVFVAGATGVIGVRLVPLLRDAGHEVIGMTRTPARAAALRELGATPVVGDVYDLDSLTAAVVSAAPDLVIHQLTDLPDDRALISTHSAANARIRRVGTANLLAAARAADVSRFIAQSVAWELPGDGAVAIREFEQTVLDASGVIIRYGQFYGPGTYYEDELPSPPRIHIDAAAARTLEALDMETGVLTIVEATDGR
jgi:nucleoside-diphosphate-sugar epimerase